MKILNCIDKTIKIFERSSLRLEYDCWMFDETKPLNMTVYPSNQAFIPNIIQFSSCAGLVNGLRYEKLSHPPEEFDYYIVNELQYILYQKQRLDMKKFLLLGQPVYDEFLTKIGYHSLITLI
jgi:hypothetical protein